MIYAIVAFFCGIFLCAAAAFGWYMLTMIKRLTAAVDLQVKATQELLGEGSFTRISKSLSALSGSMPDIQKGIEEFARVMRLVFDANQESKPPKARVVDEDQSSGFYAHSDEQAAVNEVTAEARRQKLVISDEQLAGMVTDKG